jgi:phosphoglucosamine mutase
VLVRKSGTEPLIRIMVEADKEEKCNLFVDEIIETIVSRGYGL